MSHDINAHRTLQLTSTALLLSASEICASSLLRRLGEKASARILLLLLSTCR